MFHQLKYILPLCAFMSLSLTATAATPLAAKETVISMHSWTTTIDELPPFTFIPMLYPVRMKLRASCRNGDIKLFYVSSSWGNSKDVLQKKMRHPADCPAIQSKLQDEIDFAFAAKKGKIILGYDAQNNPYLRQIP